MTDPIADMLTRIRNAQAVSKARVEMPYSKVKHNLATILKEEGYLEDVRKTEDANKPVLVVMLKYDPEGVSVIRSVQRISKPGRRVYARNTELPYILNNIGIAIISTSHGLMTNKKARKEKLGGEVICEIY